MWVIYHVATTLRRLFFFSFDVILLGFIFFYNSLIDPNADSKPGRVFRPAVAGQFIDRDPYVGAFAQLSRWRLCVQRNEKRTIRLACSLEVRR